MTQSLYGRLSRSFSDAGRQAERLRLLETKGR
jgi:hypothetical protein